MPHRSRRGLASLAVLAAVMTAVAGCGGTAPGRSAAAARPSLTAFRGLGTWVDVYDYAPRFQQGSGPPAVTPASVDDMARLGVRTLYLQAAQDDRRSQGDLVDRRLVGAFLARAHQRGIRVVAWYLPHLASVAGDLRRVQALLDFRTGSVRFDGVALDLEWTSDVKDVAKRNDALVELSRRARVAAGDRPLGAIVLEPVLIEDVNPGYWPGYPWHRIRSSYDVWLPMAYWTNRSTASGWRDGFRYTDENVRRLRADLDLPRAPVHVIGGVADNASPADVEGFVRSARAGDTLGWSMYDFATTSTSVWPRLRG